MYMDIFTMSNIFQNYFFSVLCFSPEQEHLSDLSPEKLGAGDRMALEPLNLNLNLKVGWFLTLHALNRS